MEVRYGVILLMIDILRFNLSEMTALNRIWMSWDFGDLFYASILKEDGRSRGSELGMRLYSVPKEIRLLFMISWWIISPMPVQLMLMIFP